MSDPVSFDSTSARFGLPLLFVGQAQKEDFVNEALVLVDGLLHAAIEDQRSAPPVSAIDGQSWLIGTSATGDWAGHDGELAMRQLGQWLFSVPRDGMQCLNKATGQVMTRISGAWQSPAAPAAATGGSVIDVQARAVLTSLVSALTQAGVLSA